MDYFNVKPEERPEELNVRNAVWLLLNVQHLREVAIYCEVDDQDVRFPLNHSEVSGWMRSKVKTLDLDVAIPTWSQTKVESVLKQLLSFTEGLESLKLDFTVKRDGTLSGVLPPLHLSILEVGLKHSLGTLESLS